MDFFVEKQNILGGYCTVVDGANIAPGREVDKDTSCYSSASRSEDSFTPAHVFSFIGCLDKEILQFS